MVGGFYFEAHFLKCYADVSARRSARIKRSKVKIAALIVRVYCGLAVLVLLEEKKFTFRPGVESVAKFGGFFQLVFEYAART